MDKVKVANELEVGEKNVLIRADLEWESENCPRQVATEKIVEWVKENGAKMIKVIGHKGNYKTDMAEVVNDVRHDPREEINDETMANELASGWDVYINEAFATSHRKHCSVDALPRVMKQQGKQVGIGPRFAQEIEKLNSVWTKPGKRVLVIGGAKAGDKTTLAEELASKFQEVLRGGLLPGVKLSPDGLDIDEDSRRRYVEAVKNGQVIVVAGPMGKYEVAEVGTREVFTAVANAAAYKIAGGGDTEAAIEKFGLTAKFDWISVGGGAMLEYLSKGTLPGIEALK